MPITITKPWGQEIILTDKNLPYVAKILIINSGQRLSLQYHDKKTETLTLIDGQAQLLLDNKIIDMEKNIGYTINFGIKHRITALSDCQIFEASTPEIGTTFRLEDDYNRPNENLNIKIE